MLFLSIDLGLDCLNPRFDNDAIDKLPHHLDENRQDRFAAMPIGTDPGTRIRTSTVIAGADEEPPESVKLADGPLVKARDRPCRQVRHRAKFHIAPRFFV